MPPVIGVITNNQHMIFQRLVIAGCRSIAELQGYSVVVDSLAENPDEPRPVSLNPRDVDGFLIVANAAPHEFLQQTHRFGKPVSLVSHRIDDLPIPSVVFNNVQGIREMVRHLIVDCKRSKLVFIRGIAEQFDSIQREHTFEQELMRYNLHDAQSIRGDYSAEVAVDSLREFVAQGHEFDGIVAADYVMARAAVSALREMGIKVPEQVSVVGFGDAPETRAAGITTVAADVEELGERAGRQLISQIQGLRILGVTTLAVRLIVRETSCAV